MVVKTEKCAFSEYNVYPGHGMRMVRRDGQPVTLGGSKTKSMMLQRMKPSKLQWTQGWRRLNKKMQVDTTVKKRTRKTTKFQRAIVGASLEDVRIACGLSCCRPRRRSPLAARRSLLVAAATAAAALRDHRADAEPLDREDHVGPIGEGILACGSGRRETWGRGRLLSMVGGRVDYQPTQRRRRRAVKQQRAARRPIAQHSAAGAALVRLAAAVPL